MADVNSLNSKQSEILKLFKEEVKGVAKPSHTDYDFLRFLRARNYDLKKSVKMYRESMQWRKDYDADNLLNFEDPEVLVKYFPGGFFGEDKEGAPVWYDLFGYTDIRGIAVSVTRKDLIRSRLKVAEHLFENVLPAASRKHGRLIPQYVTVYDMEGIGLKFIWRPLLDMFRDLISILDKNYPDGLKACYVVNAPSIFHILYNTIKSFYNENTRKKIRVLGSNWRQELQKYIDADQIPVHWGGTATDPDGHPKCPSKICLGGPIPDKYKMQKPDGVDLSKFSVQTVGSRSTFEVEKTLDKPNMILTWQFWTEGQDIAFGIFKRESKDQQGTEEMREIVKTERVNSNLIPENDTIVCEEPGTYVLKFDNTYSWLNSKKLSYTVEVLKPADKLQGVSQSTGL